MMLSRTLILSLAYFATGWLGLQIPYAGTHITLVWLPTGIAVAGLLRWGWPVWPAVFLGAFSVNLSIDSSLLLATGIATGNTLGPILAVWWLKRTHFDTNFNHRRDVAALITAASLGMAVSSLLGATSLVLGNLIPPAAIGYAALSWWMGDIVGVLLAAPMLLTMTRENLRKLGHDRKELLLWLLVAGPVAWFAFIQDYGAPGRTLPLAFLTLPLLAWAALRFGKTGAALAALGFSIVAAWSTATGHGALLVPEDIHVSLFLLWSYMATTVLMGLLITALQAERISMENILRDNEEKLRGLYELSPIGIALTDMSGRYIEFNDAFQHICGYTPEELKTLDYWKLTPRKYEEDEARQLELLKRTGYYGPYEKEYVRKDGSLVSIRLNGMLITRSDHEQYIWSIVEDITERKVAEEEIKQLAFYDLLTRLPNRRHLIDRLQQALASCSRNHRQGALLFIDLDNFKTLNDTLGHDKGDMLLAQVAERIKACVREGDTVARLGGDEFIVMLEDLSDKANDAASQAEIVGHKIIIALHQTYQLDSHDHHSTASAGVTLFDGTNASIDELMKQADLAMYQAKAAGRNALRFFDPEMQAAVTARAMLEKDLRHAIAHQEFSLYYQPQIDNLGRLRGAEALLRWQHPTRGMVYPDTFIPLAEETDLILPLGNWVLETACAQLVTWSKGPQTAHLHLAVNVSAQQIHQSDFVEEVISTLQRTGADPHRLKLEITESMLMQGAEDTIGKMNRLKQLGIGFALDDFGTGYSSLSYLKRLPLEKLKIDRSFVMDVLTDPNDATIARTIVVLAQSLGLSVIAEGVETEAQRLFLEQNGCHLYQGYLFSRPLPLESFEQFMANTTPLRDLFDGQ